MIIGRYFYAAFTGKVFGGLGGGGSLVGVVGGVGEGVFN